MFQPAVPVMSLPVPELEIAMTAPLAVAWDWVRPKREPVSVPLPEMLEVICRKLAVSFKEPAELVTVLRLNKTSVVESAEVRVPERLIW
jgi:hypothetical protein